MCFNPPALLFHPPPFSPPPPPPPPPQFYLVTGGNSGLWTLGSGPSFLSSTEILDPTTGVWQEAAPLPRSLWGLACGSPRPGSVVCAGGRSRVDGVGSARDEVSDGHWPLGAL